MRRRTFLKSMGALGMTAYIPASLNVESIIRTARADSPDYDAVDFSAPAVMPQVINIFLYGGPSELSGNLTNILDINANSQNAYPAGLTQAFDPDNFNRNDPNSPRITPNDFWAGAGGVPLEFMLKYGHMSVYRTIMKQKEPTRSHRESIMMSLKGSLDIENSPGVGTRLAVMLSREAGRNRGAFENIPLADGQTVGDAGGVLGLRLPFVSFEGTSTSYDVDPDNPLDIRLRGLTLNQNFNNPYTRSDQSYDSVIDSLVRKVNQASRFRAISDAFTTREEMESFIGQFESVGNDINSAMPDSARDGFTVDAEDLAFFDDGASTTLQYPNTRYTDRIRAAVILAIENPQSLYITVGGGLGGWDDHNNGMDQYPDRMDELMSVMQAAMLHIKYAGRASRTPLGNAARQTDNIVLNMFGDFGRLVNLNNSNGWDHANNQNLFTFGGAAVRPGGAAALGKIVGTTRRVGTPGTNNQYTEPTSNSYTAEPMSIAASVYSYFGVTNPRALTRDTVTGQNPDGDDALDETRASESIADADFV